MNSLTFLGFSLCCFPKFGSSVQQSDLQLYVDILDGVCPGLTRLPVKGTNFTVRYDDDGWLRIKYSIQVLRDIGSDLLIRIELRRCRSKEAPDSCSTFANLNSKLVCKILDSTSDFYSPFFTCLKPRYKCPLVKGVFHGDNCTFDMHNFSMFPVVGYYWKIKLKVFHGAAKRLVFCGVTEGGMRRKH